jgi:tetratricopeptide (TPR) repeat protein
MLRFRVFFTGLTVALVAATAARAFDEIYTSGGDKKVYKGTIDEVTKDAVKITANNQTTTVPTANIIYIAFDDSPFELKEAQKNAHATGAYAAALADVEKIQPANVQRRGQTELEFFKLLCRTELARSGRRGTPESVIADLTKFIAANQQAYNYYHANEMLGHLYRAAGNHEKALEAFRVVARNQGMSARADVAIGWTLLDQKKPAEAIKAFDKALSSSSSTDEANAAAAKLGKAACLAETGKPADAVKMIEELIAKNDPEDRVLSPRIYNVLGAAHSKANEPKAALMAYLHVDILYDQNPAEHAEALGNLATLWQSVNQSERAKDARERLVKQYPSSRWAKQ